jgi:hypothetical protein
MGREGSEDRFHAVNCIANSKGIGVGARTNLNNIIERQPLRWVKGARRADEEEDHCEGVEIEEGGAGGLNGQTILRFRKR